jgi:hypothetical protein
MQSKGQSLKEKKDIGRDKIILDIYTNRLYCVGAMISQPKFLRNTLGNMQER